VKLSEPMHRCRAILFPNCCPDRLRGQFSGAQGVVNSLSGKWLYHTRSITDQK
jgi:hypothetical protein